MKQFKIIESFQLQSHPQKLLLQPNQFYSTESDAEIAELEQFALDGSCQEMGEEKSSDEQPESDTTDTSEEPMIDPEEDITIVPGVGNALKQRLEEANITTVSQLRDAMSTQEEAMQELLGNAFEKVQTYFSS